MGKNDKSSYLVFIIRALFFSVIDVFECLYLVDTY
jgi:hypothetical protein